MTKLAWIATLRLLVTLPRPSLRGAPATRQSRKSGCMDCRAALAMTIAAWIATLRSLVTIVHRHCEERQRRGNPGSPAAMDCRAALAMTIAAWIATLPSLVTIPRPSLRGAPATRQSRKSGSHGLPRCARNDDSRMDCHAALACDDSRMDCHAALASDDSRMDCHAALAMTIAAWIAALRLQ